MSKVYRNTGTAPGTGSKSKFRNIHAIRSADSSRGSNAKNLPLRRCSTGSKEATAAGEKGGNRKDLLFSKVPGGDVKIISRKEYEYFQERARTVSKEEREAAIAAAERERDRLIKESMARREAFRQMDMQKRRAKDPRFNEIEEESRRRAMHILERAHNLRLEQEEEIKICNRFILETKCRAIRDAQIAEKRAIEKELAEEEKRLDEMMENERRWAIKEQMEKEQEEVTKKHQFAKVLKDQIVENEEQRVLEFERKQEESRLINLSNIAWQEEKIAQLRDKAARNERLRKEFIEGNEQLKHFKAMEEEENKIIDLRIKEYQRLKEEREMKLEQERKMAKKTKDLEKEMAATQAAHMREMQEHIDEVNAARVQEEVEREWRRKEKEEALKRAQSQKILQAERDQQIRNKRVMQAVEVERDKREFEKILRAQQEAFCREKEEIERKQQKALLYRSEILKQVNEKEKERIRARQQMFEEGLAIRTEVEMRKRKLRAAMERKCQEMKENKVPEIYINEVKRMIENMK